MKRKLLILVMIFVIVAMLLGGCNYCCPTCPPQQEEEIHPEIIGTIYFCDLLEKAREWTPCADYRWMKSEYYELTSKADIEWALDEIGPWGCCISLLELIDLFHNQSGYENVPLGYVVYKNGTMKNVAVYKEGDKVKAVLLIDGKLEEFISDCCITEIII